MKLLVAGLAGLLASCSATVPTPTALDLQRAATLYPQIQLAELEEGRTLYLERCTRCHHAFSPTEHPPEAWRHQIAEMRERAKLSAESERLVTAYLVTLALRP